MTLPRTKHPTGGFDDHLPNTAAPATQRTLPPEGFKDAHDPRDRIRDLHQEPPWANRSPRPTNRRPMQSDVVRYAGQAVAIVVAESQRGDAKLRMLGRS
jgi:CO/xanthine dehydrogenase Mo-binding subunit